MAAGIAAIAYGAKIARVKVEGADCHRYEIDGGDNHARRIERESASPLRTSHAILRLTEAVHHCILL